MDLLYLINCSIIKKCQIWIILINLIYHYFLKPITNLHLHLNLITILILFRLILNVNTSLDLLVKAIQSLHPFQNHLTTTTHR
jgi:hypothetical protein